MGLVRRYWYNQTTSVKLDALGFLATLLHVKPSELISGSDNEEQFPKLFHYSIIELCVSFPTFPCLFH